MFIITSQLKMKRYHIGWFAVATAVLKYSLSDKFTLQVRQENLKNLVLFLFPHAVELLCHPDSSLATNHQKISYTLDVSYVVR